MYLQLEPLFEQSMDCLCIANYDGYFVKTNPAFVKLLGYSEEELRSKLISEFIYEEDRKLTAAHREKLKKNVPLINFENRYVCKNGELVWLHWTSIPMEKEQLIYAIAKDVTYKKELESERISRLSQLSEVNEKLKRLNYTTSHDLRSPLNNLISMVDLIDPSKIEDAETVEILSFIRLSAEGLKASLNLLVDASKQNNILAEKQEMIGFNAILLKVQKAIGTLIQNAGTKFEVDFSALEGVEFIPSYMESVFLNLITNSIKYARPGVPPIVSIKSSCIDGVKTLVYSDNGMGFDMDKVGHLVFSLNQKFHGNKDSKGVGLYLVHSHITCLGGSITVDSRVNEGTTFTIGFK
ncbi:PAS domain-containing sensor histidine kinase [Flagellimonas taeanensis]|nr:MULTISPECIES: PAS domain-containing sensor histidine kinase [Allomuricauda]MDC6383857.1 PAS domain-containing sensor histidine kinase [Muricauda sp. SK9]RIV48764.1 PAS domain-containing sensor histidine kinase [Allomuricauda taeanensis]